MLGWVVDGVERVGLTVHAPCCRVLGGGAGAASGAGPVASAGSGVSPSGDGARGTRAGWHRWRGWALLGSAQQVATVLEQHGSEPATEGLGVVDPADQGAAQVERPVDRADEGAQRQLESVLALDDLGEGSDRCRAARLERREDGPLGGDAGSRVGVVEDREDRSGRFVVGAALDGEGALAGGGQHLERVDRLGDVGQPVEPGQAGTGEHDRVERAVVHQPDPGVDVAADVLEREPEAEGGELGDPARRAGADHGTVAELAERPPAG